MRIQESKLRVVGYLTVTVIFFFFFMMEMLFSWRDEHLYSKVLVLTILHTLAMWEPTRLVILKLRKRLGGLTQVRRRIMTLLGFAVPYAVLIGFLRIFTEDRTNLWGVPMANWTAYSYTIGITLLFILLQIAVYESIYFFAEWNRSTSEAEELKRLNVQAQMESLKVQIQPHFLFNTLNTLIGLIEVNQARAVSFTQELAYVYRYLLDASENTLISLEEEVRFANTYFSLLKTRYPEELQLQNDLVDIADCKVPPLTLQILLENAVKHNVVTKNKPLSIHMYLDEEKSRVIVKNNYQVKTSSSAKGMGLKHLRKKFALLDLSDVNIQLSNNQFIVSFPVVKTKIYESSYH
jgi:hypothetical protein